MLAPSPVVKQTAKTALSERFLHSVAASTVLIFAVFSVELIASLVSIYLNVIGYLITNILLFVFAIFPLGLGHLYYFRRLLWGQKDSLLIIFKYFSSKEEYKRALHFIFILCSKLLFVAVILFLPCIVVWFLSSEHLYNWLDISLPVWASNLWALNSFLVIVAIFILVFVMLKYYLAPFIFVGKDDIDPAEAVNMSAIISKRTGGDFFGLMLSFSGWFVLSIFVAPLIFTLPYFAASYSVHCRFAITAYNRDVDRFIANDTPSYSTDEI